MSVADSGAVAADAKGPDIWLVDSCEAVDTLDPTPSLGTPSSVVSSLDGRRSTFFLLIGDASGVAISIKGNGDVSTSVTGVAGFSFFA